MTDEMKYGWHYRALEKQDGDIHRNVLAITNSNCVIRDFEPSLWNINNINYEIHAAIKAATWLYEDFP